MRAKLCFPDIWRHTYGTGNELGLRANPLMNNPLMNNPLIHPLIH